ncbi:MAG: hypothetical protein JXB49_16090 [Bacteroidales bacterium]|nr:hypothetical protein [Bacteroidales bacterium]
MKNRKGFLFYPLIITALAIILLSGCKKDDDDDDDKSASTGIKAGIWTGMYDGNLELSIVVDENKIEQVNIICEASDDDYLGTSVKNKSYGPYSVADLATVTLTSSTTIDGESTDVKVNISLTFGSDKKATGTITYSENNVVKKTSNIVVDWVEAVPTTGAIRDGCWSGGISEPIYAYFSFEIEDGKAESISYFYMDSRTFTIGTMYKSIDLAIGDNLTFSLNPSIDVDLDFTGYMEGDGTIALDLVSGDQSMPVTCDWSPLFPDDKKKSSDAELEKQEVMEVYGIPENTIISGTLK